MTMLVPVALVLALTTLQPWGGPAGGVAGAVLAGSGAPTEPVASAEGPVPDRLSLVAANASPGFDPQSAEPVVNVRLDRRSAAALGRFTAANVGRLVELSIDGRVLSTVAVREAIVAGNFTLSGNMTVAEVTDIAVKLRGEGKLDVRVLPRDGETP